MQKRNDWGFWVITAFIGFGSIGGWMSLAREVQRLYPQTVAGEISDAPGLADSWEPLGTDSKGREFLRRTASNGDIERLTIMEDGVGLYVRCEAPDPFPDVSGCAKIILQPRAP